MLLSALQRVGLAGGEAVRITFVVDRVALEKPLAVDLHELVVPTAEAQPLDLTSVGIVAVVHPVGDGAGTVAVDLDYLVSDEVPHRRRPLLAIRSLCWREVHFSQVIGSAGHELPDRSAAFDFATRPIEDAVLGEHGGIA